MAEKNAAGQKPFNFGNAPLVKKTEEKVVNDYEAIETKPLTTAVSNDYGEPMQNINVPIPVSLHQQLKIYAAQTKQNMKDLVVMAIKDFMEKQG